MNEPASQDHAKRIARAIAYLDAHLDAPVRLEDLAAAACLSAFHFHRIYRAATGETPADTVRRRRLFRAAGQLVRSKATLLRIAKQAGYGSLAAFGRAFQAAYGIAPAAYRKKCQTPMPPEMAIQEEKRTMYKVDIHDLPAIRIAGLRHVGPYIEIGGSFERLTMRAGSLGLVGAGTKWIGVWYDDPGSVAAAELRSDACLSVPADFQGADDLRVFDLAGGRHAVLRFQGSYVELEKPYRWLFGEWLAQSGETAADRPAFEIYVNDCRTLPPSEWLTDIHLPLAARAG